MATAIQTEQRQRRWLDLTEYEAPDWARPALNEKTKTRQYSTLPGLVPLKTSMISERLLYDNPPPSSVLEKTLSKVPESAVSTVNSGQARPFPEKALPKVPKQSSSIGKVGPVELSYGTFTVPSVPHKPEAIGKTSSNPVKSAFKESLEDSSTSYPPGKDSGYCEASLENSCQYGKSSRAERAVAAKKRDLTTDPAPYKISKFQPASIREQCRKLLHDALNLPGFHGPRNTNSDLVQPELEHKIIEANNGKHNDLEKRSPFRSSPFNPPDAAALHPYHIFISRDVRVPTTPANSVASDDEYPHSNAMNRTIDDRNSPNAYSRTAENVRHIRSLHLPSSGSLLAVDRVTPNYADMPTSTPSLQVISTNESAIFDADRIIVEVLRRIDGRMETSTKNERMPVLKVTESLTREVLCICKDLTDGRPIQIV
jgi:hypothetical protein